MWKRSAASLRVLAAACMAAPLAAGAQNFPVKPIRIIVGFGPGGAADVTARLIAPRLNEELGQNIIIENRTGAGSLIANERVAKSPPDGYTLAMVSSAATILPALRKDMPYDVERDLAPVALVVKSAHVLLVHPSLPVRKLPDFIALARANPDKMSFGHSGYGSANHMAGELLNLMAKTRIKHVPYKGGAENVIAAASGETEVTYGSLVAATSFITSGKLRALGITGPRRSALLPEVPTISEAGLPGYESTAWYGIMAPGGVAKPIIAQLNAAIVKGAQTSDVRQLFNKQGLDAQTDTPEQFGEYIRAEIAKNVTLVKAAGLKPD